jgi:hypothetical protein
MMSYLLEAIIAYLATLVLLMVIICVHLFKNMTQEYGTRA